MEAAARALSHAGREPEEIGAVLFCSCTNTRLIPAAAARCPVRAVPHGGGPRGIDLDLVGSLLLGGGVLGLLLPLVEAETGSVGGL